MTAAPCGAAADAVLGCCRLLLVHGTQGTLQQRLRGAVQAMEVRSLGCRVGMCMGGRMCFGSGVGGSKAQ